MGKTSILHGLGHRSRTDSSIEAGDCFFDGTYYLDSGVIDAAGTASITVSTLSAGAHTITAWYEGDNIFNASNGTGDLTVGQADTSTNIALGPANSVLGQTIVIAAQVSAVSPGSGIPTGMVDFFADGTLVGSGTLNATGNANVYVNTLEVGTHAITASYEGDANFNASSSDSLTQTVSDNVNSTSTAVGSDLDPSHFSQDVTFTATVTPADSSLGVPQGWVVFYDEAANDLG